MRLTYTDRAATAALHILDNTSLANLLGGPPLTVKAIGPMGSKDFTLTVTEWGWSSGESFLIDVLRSITGRTFADLAGIRTVDERTASVVVEAIAYLAGLELATEGKHRAA